ncbi:MAG: DUF1343 domain-containing protein [Bacteroidales bacterium]|nr:DUF1343 domain-containing protein [Bacteroidales bacterium]
MKKYIVLSLILTFLSLGLYSQNKVIVGAERFEEYLSLVKNKKVGILTNQTSVVRNQNGDFIHLLDTLLSLDVDVIKIFSPEHGFRGNVEAGGYVNNSVDSKTNLPIISLYGKNKKPTKEQIKDCEVILFDLQDVGCRFYTYISTLHYVMEACAENNCKLIVLDRPNPNDYIDGPVLDAKFQSFVGMHRVPVLHAMTIGEYAKMINGEGWLENSIQCDLQVIEIFGWEHDMKEVYQLFVAPSPNLQTPKAIELYPSLCFFEGTKVSVGRGTDTPFEIIGYPDYYDKTFSFTPRAIKGVSDNPMYKGKKCYGMKDLKVQKKELDLSFLIKMYKTANKKEDFFNSFFDKLAGTDQLRKQIERGLSQEEIKLSWQKDIEKFKKIRQKYLLYQ